MGCYRIYFLQVSLLILITSICGQQFNLVPGQTFPQQQYSPSHTIKNGINQTQPHKHVIIPLEQMHVLQNEMKQTTVRHNRQSPPIVRTILRPLEPTTPRTSIPNQSSIVQHTANSQLFEQSNNFQQLRPTMPVNPSQNFQIPSFSGPQQIFQLTTPFPEQKQILNTIQRTQNPVLNSQPQSSVPINQIPQINNQIKATPVQQISQTITQLSSPTQIQQPPSTLQQQQEQIFRLQTTTPTQTFSTIPQQSLTNTVSEKKFKHAQDIQPQLQKPENQQSEEEVTLSPEQILFEHQAKNAKYSFNSVITDDIMDNTQIREEARDGLLVTGLYSYSDGFYKRTVHYEADEKGYRIIKEEVEPIGSGPQLNPDGNATVSSNFGGVKNKYTITAADIAQLQRNGTI